MTESKKETFSLTRGLRINPANSQQRAVNHQQELARGQYQHAIEQQTSQQQMLVRMVEAQREEMAVKR